MINNILVTGGAGFIGSNFIRMLLNGHSGINVVNLDFLTYAGNLSSLSDCAEKPGYVFVHGDIKDYSTVSGTIKKYGIEGIINFAAESHVDRSISGPGIFIETNVTGTLNLLQCARECKVKRFMQISTDEVYGSLGRAGMFTEESLIKPNSPYSASKAAADHLVHAFHHTFGMDTVITRCSNNYGPYQFPEKMIPLCINNARHDRPIPVYGDGLQIRDWLYVYDHCTAIWEVFRKASAGDVFNVGGCNEKNNLELVKTILGILGKPDSLISFVTDRPGHDRRYAIDASKIMKAFNWKPSVTFEEGIEKTVRWYLANQEWLDMVTSGDYRKYYDQMYSGKNEE